MKRPTNRATAALFMLAVIPLFVTACQGTEVPNEATTEEIVPQYLNPEQSASRIVACLRDKGLSVLITSDPSQYEVQMGGRSAEEVSGAVDDCNLELEKIGMFSNPLGTPELAGLMYDHMTEVHECLKGLGYPSDAPPSRQSFLDDVQEGYNAESWDPYNQVFSSGLDIQTLTSLEKQCPSMPSQL